MSDWDQTSGSHQGQRSCTAQTGRTHDLHPTAKLTTIFPLQRGRRPHMGMVFRAGIRLLPRRGGAGAMRRSGRLSQRSHGLTRTSQRWRAGMRSSRAFCFAGDERQGKPSRAGVERSLFPSLWLCRQRVRRLPLRRRLPRSVRMRHPVHPLTQRRPTIASRSSLGMAGWYVSARASTWAPCGGS
jgi:hypothetical protein